MQEILRLIPKVDKLLTHKDLRQFNTLLLKKAIYKFLSIYKQELLTTQKVKSLEECIECIQKIIKTKQQKSLKPLVNATGIVVHTNLGRSILSNEILEEVKPLLTSYNNLEYDAIKGERGERYIHLSEILKNLLDTEDVLVVNNNAAAVFLILNTFAKNKEVIVSRGELIEIGGSFRIPKVMEDSGAILKEVGTTNKTHLKDYKEAINQNTAMLFKAHKSNYEIVGFSKEVPYKELIDLAKEHNLLDYYDLGSGFFKNACKQLSKYELSLEEIASLKPSLVSFSGDKLLGGVQAGIIFGKKKYIQELKKNQLLRMLRVDKVTLSLLEAIFSAYLEEKYDKIPTICMLNLSKEILKQKCENLLKFIPNSFNPKIITTQTYSGGGAMPNKPFSSYGVALHYKKAKILEAHLRSFGIIARIEKEQVILDSRTLLKGDELRIQNALLQDIKA
ncbi:L-seryl-tRNA(Sec) selenium transferase [Helicobacter burdigaliensis]|uniref:L-seryl-tRNA(Sec) selenium transferase n=1 Tax=Helicobacter burdigaliensis TaxID=2315334 RepID=UPI000EF685B6|nr:L-seryl-tRNA(Sec) selenium transferase [Helicobacter burdigaliensis]